MAIKKSSKTRNKKKTKAGPVKRVEGKKLKKRRNTKKDGPKSGYGISPKMYGKQLAKSRSEASSDSGNIRQGGLMTGTANNRLRPRIEFWKRQQFYLTVGRVQNVTESYVLNILNREWYYDAGDTEDESPQTMKAIELMEQWEEQFVVTKIIGELVRNWIVNGIHIISPKDWVPMQLQSLESKSRDKSGKTTFFYQRINGIEKPIPAEDFLEIPYIELDREPWPVGMYDSLMNSDFLDVDGGDPIASLELYRQALQDNMRIHHKFASPRVIYTAEGVDKTVMDDDIVPVLEGMKNGDRAAFNAAIKIEQETVDGNARFIEHVNKIIDEIDTGLQSSANRLITEPSAMADAREANSQDDDRVLGIMERIRVLWNKEVIPRVTGLEPGKVVLKWGAKDVFDIELPEALEKAVQLNIITTQQAQIILEDERGWKIPSPEQIKEKFGEAAIDPTKKPEEPEVKPDAEKVAKKAVDKVSKEAIATFESLKDSKELDTQIKNEKLVFYKNANHEMDKIKNE